MKLGLNSRRARYGLNEAHHSGAEHWDITLRIARGATGNYSASNRLVVGADALARRRRSENKLILRRTENLPMKIVYAISRASIYPLALASSHSMVRLPPSGPFRNTSTRSHLRKPTLHSSSRQHRLALRRRSRSNPSRVGFDPRSQGRQQEAARP